jgi:hypothetical protein
MKSHNLIVMRVGLFAALLPLMGGSALAQDDGQTVQSEVVPQTIRVFTGGSHFYKRVLTEDAAVVLNPGPIAADGFSAYVNLPGAGPGNGALGRVTGTGTLINVRFTAESQCAGGGGDFDWCGVRILVNGVEAQPAPADFAFDSTSNGDEGEGSWEAHAMDRHLCVRNPNGGTINVPVQVQWRVFAGLGGVPPQFRLDDWSLTIESAAATCQ